MLSTVLQGQQPKHSALSSQHSLYAAGTFQLIFDLKSLGKSSCEIKCYKEAFMQPFTYSSPALSTIKKMFSVILHMTSKSVNN